MAHVTLPKQDQTGTNEWADVQDNDVAIINQVNGNLDSTNLANNAVTTAKITDSNVTTAKIADENVTGVKLSDDVVGVYRTLLAGGGSFPNDAVAGTYGLDLGTTGQIGWATAIEGSSAVGFGLFPAVYLDDADFSVSGRTTKLRLRAQAHVNATSPGTITYTVGLYPLTVAGAADTLTWTLGTVVSGSTLAIANPSTSTITSGVGSDFNVPSDGLYVFGCVTNATLANNSAVALSCQLQAHHV